ncbi:unnamed protein product, partial [Phytomonas sp. Hart1]
MVPSRNYHKRPEVEEEDDGDGRGAAPTEADVVSLSAAFRGLLQNPDYVLLLAGLCVFSFVGSGLAVWGIPALVQGPLRVEKGHAAVLIGGTTALCGVSGAFLGGRIIDLLGGSQGDVGIMNCMFFSQIILLIVIPCGLIAFLQTHLWLFLILFVVVVFSLFLITAPVNACILAIVQPSIRPYAIAISVFFLHIVGDISSPTIVGFLSDQFGHLCMLHTDEKTCHANQRERCSWRPVSTTDHVWRCWYEVQLRNALLITFSLLSVTLLCWNGVYNRARARLKSAGWISPTNVDPSSETNSRSEGARI